jgi:hypothetical protein
MQCPHLSGKQVPTCMVDSAVYVPSIAELEEYCLSKKYEECPFLHNFTNADKSLLHSADGMRPFQ